MGQEPTDIWRLLTFIIWHKQNFNWILFFCCHRKNATQEFVLTVIPMNISQTLLSLSGFGSAARSTWLHQPPRCEVTIWADWQHARAEGRPTGLSLCSQSIIHSQLIDRILWKVRCYPTPLNLKNAGESLMAHLLEMDQLWIWPPFAQSCAKVALAGVSGATGVGTETL